MAEDAEKQRPGEASGDSSAETRGEEKETAL